MSKRLWLAAVPLIAVSLIAGVMIASATGPVWAFTQQTLNPNGNYNFDYGPLDDKAKSGGSTNNPDSNSSGFHFSVQGGQQASPYGFHSFGGDNPPEPPGYRPLGNGN
jgi:hypothetical protein